VIGEIAVIMKHKILAIFFFFFFGGLKGLVGLFLWIVGRVLLWVVAFGFSGCSQ
jgi:hypothetical protein